MTEEVVNQPTIGIAEDQTPPFDPNAPIDYHQFHAAIFKDVKIFIATPMYGGNCLGTYARAMNDLIMLCASNGIHIRYFYLFNESLIQRARNYCADEFLRSDCTHLVFIDADIAFNPVTLLQMIAVQISNPEKYQIVAAPYPKKNINWNNVIDSVRTGALNPQYPQSLEYFGGALVMNFIPGTKQFQIQEPVEVLEAGTGFMSIPRAVLEKWAAAYPEMAYKPDHIGTEHFDGSREIHAYFHCDIDPKTGRYLSEDYFFCQKWRDAGGSIHMCPWMELQHTGSYTFKGSIPALAALEQAKQNAAQQAQASRPVSVPKFDPSKIQVGNVVTGKPTGTKKKRVKSRVGTRS
jgi:hypothetical protein